MRAGIEENFQGFKTKRENGALMGPWNPWLHDPKFGKPIWELTKALSFSPSLPRPVREVAPADHRVLTIKLWQSLAR
jgi:4-carboxymuconolactone decarboxylase